MRLIDADSLEECKEIMTTIDGESKYAVRMDDIRNMPTITIPTAELDTTNDFAEWIDVNGDGSIMKCSKCGEKVCCKGNNFCPNCGADMRVKNELKRVSKELNKELNSENTTLFYSMTNGDNFIGKEGDENG